MVPNDGATPRASQPPIQLQGVGAGNSGNLNATVSDDIYLQGSVLDLRSLASPAKFDTRGSGLLKIDGLTVTDRCLSTVSFIQITNTTLHVNGCAFARNPSKLGQSCDQEGIVLGGSTSVFDNSADSSFTGYGTKIDGCHFHRIRRAVYGRERCNSIIVLYNPELFIPPQILI